VWPNGLNASSLEGKILPTHLFEGIVFSGKGEGKKFISLPWVKKQIQENLGFTPFDGTLNIRLTTKNSAKKQLLKKAFQKCINPEKGYCPGYLVKAQIENTEAAIVIPQIPNYQDDILEIIAPEYLREKLKLIDGSHVVVKIKA
jgi:riboflavin kinase